MSRSLLTIALSAALTVTSLGTTGASGAIRHQAAAERSVSIAVDNRAPDVGERVTFSGEVSPSLQAERVRLEVRKADATRWKAVRTTRLDDGEYQVTHRVRTPGIFRYRVVALRTDRSPVALSGRVVKVSVYRYLPLTSLPTQFIAGFTVGTAQMSGHDRPNSLITTGDGAHTVDYELGGMCTGLIAYDGAVDGSPPEGQLVSESVSVDPGRVRGPFAANPHIWTFHRAQTLRLTMTTMDGAVAAFGSPTVHCRF